MMKKKGKKSSTGDASPATPPRGQSHASSARLHVIGGTAIRRGEVGLTDLNGILVDDARQVRRHGLAEQTGPRR